MKLIFEKSEDNEISVSIANGDTKEHFDYIEMVKTLIEEREMETPEMIGEFSVAEISSIQSMARYLNESLQKTENTENTD